MSEQPGYHSLDELKALSLEELQALWDMVPTERQKAYHIAYDREVRNAGALGSMRWNNRSPPSCCGATKIPHWSRWARAGRVLPRGCRKPPEKMIRSMMQIHLPQPPRKHRRKRF